MWLEDFGRKAGLNVRTDTIWRFGPFNLNTATSELTRDGNHVKIEPQSLRLLDYLIQNRDRAVTRDDLIAAIWDGRIISDWAISAAIKSLRAVLGDQAPERQFVRTVHSKGYRFVAEVRRQPPPQTSRTTVLVRLFRSGSDNVDDTYLTNGLTEDLITDLSRASAISVLSYNTSRALQGDEPSGALGVDRIVDGSLRRLGETLRLNIGVLDGDGGRQLWAERFDLTQDSLLAGQDRMSARLQDILSPGHGASDQSRDRTGNPLAYDHYLKGRYAYFRYEPQAFVEALGHFTKASELDPSFADAFAQQAYCRTTLYVFGLPGADENLVAAESLARKAIALNHNSALGYARLGWILGFVGKPDQVIQAFDEAAARDHENPEIYLAYGETMNRLAQPEIAMPLIERAFSKDSYFPPSWEFARGHAHLLKGEHEEAIADFGSVLERVPGFVPARVQMVRATFEIGNKDAAAAAIQNLKSVAPKYSLAHAGRMFPYPAIDHRDALLGALELSGLT